MKRSSHHVISAHILVLVLVLLPPVVAADESAPAPLSFAERVACVEKVEDVYWSHRIWPDANSIPKPRRDKIMSHAQVAAKVERSLLLETALDLVWGERLSTERIQIELNRIVRSTQHPVLLGDVFSALDHDAFLVAECYVRPSLVERLISERYASDKEIHRELRDRVVADLAGARKVEDIQDSTAEVADLILTLADDAGLDDGSASAELSLAPDEWQSMIQELAGRFQKDLAQGPGAPVPSDTGELLARRVGRGVSPIFETDGAFAVVEILEAGDGRLRVASATWHKVGFSEWLAVTGKDLRFATPSGGSYALPKLAAGDPCIDDTWKPTAGSGSPSARRLHTMVWTGTEMIVWGGFDNTQLATGGRYDPATDTWVPTSTTGAPSGRYGAAGVWTGSEVVVWGGYDGSYSNTGGRYNPATDNWMPTSTVNAPSGRIYIDGLWTGTEMIVWGGYNYTATGGRYDPSADTWAIMSTTDAPSARGYHVMVWTGSELIAWGGSDGSALDTGGRYDPGADTWTATSTTGAPPPSFSLTGVWTGAEMIVWGGDPYGSPLDTGGRYDPATDSWTATSTADAPLARGAHTAVWTGTEMIVWGGRDHFDEYGTGGRYDPITDMWTATSTIGAPIPRGEHRAVWTGTEMIVWGGHTGSYTNTGGRYDPITDSWMATSPNNLSARYVHSAVWTGAEMVVWGGQDKSPYTNTGSRYDPASDSWTAMTTTDVPTGRGRHRAVWTGTEMIVWGGWDGPTAYFNTGGRYDPATDSWTDIATSGAPPARYDHAEVWTGTEMIVWGGTVSGASAQTGGRFDPATDSWTATSTVGAPSDIYDTVAAWTGSEMLVWGGSSATNEGGRYDPVADSWTPTSMTGAPESRQWPTGVWTGSELIVWGGYTGSANLDSGGRYDPSTDTWIATSTVSAPAARRLPGSVWTGTEMIVWAGADDSGKVNTGGRYDPATDSWTPTTNSGAPSPRYGQTSVWTGSGGEMIVWGGDGTSMYTDTGGLYCASGVLGIDYGDAPDPSYPTLSASNGARHPFDGVLYLGSTVDGESDGQPTASSDGDDLDGSDDEDGVTFTSALRLGLEATVDVIASAPGLLNAWIDFNFDGDWADAGEQVFTDEPLATGVNALSISVPPGATLGTTFGRYRLDSLGGLSFDGIASDGEVEDYMVEIVEGPDLQIEMTASKEPAPSGRPLTYTINVTNDGPSSASSVTVTDTLPGEVVFVSSSPGAPDCNFAVDTITCDLGTMAPTDAVVITIEAMVGYPEYGGFSNTASVAATENDPVPANNTATVDTIIALFVDGFETGDLNGWD
jgi:uncharacterized repeat protein (TIGR01451 family)